MTTVDILQTLVGIPTVSALSPEPLLEEITGLLVQHGWHVERLPYVSGDGLEKANLIAVPESFREQLPEVDLLFVCHTDTVPYSPAWAGATQLAEVNGQLHGRGSCDVKGSMAGLLSAALQVNPSDLPMPVALAFTAEEEIGCIGATRLVASGAIRPRRVIVCEPTSLRPATAGKGYGLAEVRVTGREAHSALPALGASAINTAAHFITRLETQERSARRATDARFSPPYTTFNVGVLHGGTAKNIVAGECTFLVEWRPLPAESPAAGGEVIRTLAAEVSAERSPCRVDVNILRAEPGFGSGESFLGATLVERLGRAETGISFGSEATRFAVIAEEVVVIGPGDMATAHSERECVPIDELEEWTKTVKYLLVNGLNAVHTRGAAGASV